MRQRGQSGFALLIVLWLLVPLSVLFLILSGTARSDTQLTGNLRDAAKLEALADGAINTAIFDLMQSRDALGTITTRLQGAALGVQVISQSGLVNPNVASVELLRALLVRLGVQSAQAEGVAAAIVDWRSPGQRARPNGAKTAEYRAAGRDYGPPGAPFETLDELQDVLGMTPQIAAALRPYLTLYADRDPDPALAPPLVRAALGDLGARLIGQSDPGDVFQITAVARGGTGALVGRRAVVRIGFTANGRGWRVLAWSNAPSS